MDKMLFRGGIRKALRRGPKDRREEHDVTIDDFRVVPVVYSNKRRDLWSNADKRKGAEVLVHLRKLMQAHGVRSIFDPRVAPEVRKLWRQLIGSDAIKALSVKEFGLLWEYADISRSTVLCGTHAVEPAELQECEMDGIPTFDHPLTEAANAVDSRESRRSTVF